MGNVTNTDAVFANFSCPSSIPLGIPRSHLVIWASFSSLLSLWSIISNSVLIYALHKTCQLKNATGKFLIAMSTSDLLMGLAVLPLLTYIILMQLIEENRNCALEDAVFYLGTASVYFSLLMLISIAYDRYLHVSKLMRYQEFMNNCRITMIMFSSILACNIPQVTAILLPVIYFQIIILTVDTSAVIAICIFYNSVLKSVTSHSLRFRNISQSESETQKKFRAKRELSLTKRIRTLFAILIALYVPFHMTSTVQVFFEHFHPEKFARLRYYFDISEYLSVMLLSSTACVNSTVFCICNSQIKRFLRQRCCSGRLMVTFEGDVFNISESKEAQFYVTMDNNNIAINRFQTDIGNRVQERKNAKYEWCRKMYGS